MSLRTDPSKGVVAYVASDDVNDNIRQPSGFYVGTAGNATLIFEDGTSESHVGLAAGVLYPFGVVRVAATPAPTAADFVAHYSVG